jgi:hypothetical protein
MVPLATTTITVLEVSADPDRDPYDAQPDPVAVATGVRAHISTSTGDETVRGGQREEVTFRLSCDPVPLTHTHQVRDEQTGEVYEVVWARPRTGFGMDHVQAGLRQVRGIA